MGFDQGCCYCDNLICVKEPLLEFMCKANPDLKIQNAGACFIARMNSELILIRDCPDFKRDIL